MNDAKTEILASPEYESYLKTKALLLSDAEDQEPQFEDPQHHETPVPLTPPSNQYDDSFNTVPKIQPEYIEMEEKKYLNSTPTSSNYSKKQQRGSMRSTPRSRKGKSPHPKILSRINGTRETISKINMKITERVVLKSTLSELKHKHLQIEKKLKRYEDEAKMDRSSELKKLRSYGLFKRSFDDKKMDALDCEKRIADCEMRIRKWVKEVLRIKDSIEPWVDSDVRIAMVYDEICDVVARARLVLKM